MSEESGGSSDLYCGWNCSTCHPIPAVVTAGMVDIVQERLFDDNREADRPLIRAALEAALAAGAAGCDCGAQDLRGVVDHLTWCAAAGEGVQ
jgi:hypothetical protein